uniref:Uncharacterized protein n=1 Tax=Arundo donax TaxID=35708 RepID=A0A0A8XXU0_ARUDO
MRRLYHKSIKTRLRKKAT